MTAHPPVPSWSIGGIAYRAMLHSTHVMAVAGMVYLGGATWSRVLDYQHSSNLWQARCDWISRRASDTEDIAVCMDSDTSVDPAQMLAAMDRMSETAHRCRDVAMGVVPVLVDQTQLLNIVHWVDGRLTRMSRHEMQTLFSRTEFPSVSAGGWGAVALWLPWWREHYRHPVPEVQRWMVDVRGADPSGSHGWPYGEDISICLAARARGGRILALPVDSAHAPLTAAPGQIEGQHSLHWEL